VFNPILDEMYSASKGQGSFLNGAPISVSSEGEVVNSLVDSDYLGSKHEKLVNSVRSLRKTGAASLAICSVAMGRLDAYIETGVKVWDYAAASLIVTEAGGIIENPFGQQKFKLFDTSLITGNKNIVPKLKAIIS